MMVALYTVNRRALPYTRRGGHGNWENGYFEPGTDHYFFNTEHSTGRASLDTFSNDAKGDQLTLRGGH